MTRYLTCPFCHTPSPREHFEVARDRAGTFRVCPECSRPIPDLEASLPPLKALSAREKALATG